MQHRAQTCLTRDRSDCAQARNQLVERGSA
jgi:hypothetical protein